MTDISPELRLRLVMQTSNEQSLSAGEIYFHILRCDEQSDAEMIDWWWAQIQSSDERKELKKLFARRNLNTAFRKLARFHGLGPEMRAGMVGSVLRLKCDEEIIRYLTHIHDSWTHILDYNVTEFPKVDYQTINQLKGRNLTNSRSDQELLWPAIQNGTIFNSFDPPRRADIFQRLKAFPRRIPSLHLFFEDFKYFAGAAGCLKKLIRPKRRQTMLQALAQSFTGRHEEEVSHQAPVTNTFGPRSANDRAIQFDQAYRRLYLFAMRNLDALRPGSIRVEKLEARVTKEKEARAWYDLAKQAYHLGFRSREIRNELAKNPDVIEARRFLLRARNTDTYVYDGIDFEACVNQILPLLAKAKRIERAPGQARLVIQGDGEGIERRSGWPQRKAYEQSAKLLTLVNMHVPDVFDLGELSPFFVRRDVYLSFFGHQDGMAQTPLIALPPSRESSTSPVAREGSSRATTSRDLVVYNREHEGGTQPQQGATFATQTDTLEPPDSPIPSSHYSQNSDLVTVSAEPIMIRSRSYSQTQDVSVPSNALVVEGGYSEAVAVKFVALSGSEQTVVEEVTVIDPFDSHVEQVAWKFAGQGMALFDTNFRSLAPSQCLRSALKDDSNTIIVVAEESLQKTLSASRSNLKRQASEELSGRPRKFLVIP